MFKSVFVLILVFISISIFAEKPRSPGQIAAEAPITSWRDVDSENILHIQLETGTVIVELAPFFAPGHVANIKALAREGFYKNLEVYRFVEGFVAQGGDRSNQKPIKSAKRTISGEPFVSTTDKKVQFTLVDTRDGYAFETGYVGGFPAARNSSRDEYWMPHCNGVFAMARQNDTNSGGTEFYITLGHAPRYLDRNVAVFGRVLDGMGAVLSLQRNEVEGELFNRIIDVKVAADIVKRDDYQVMKTDSADFLELIESRKNRPEEWFLETPGYVDVCGVPIPTRIKEDRK